MWHLLGVKRPQILEEMEFFNLAENAKNAEKIGVFELWPHYPN
jgi:hypothetical protein